MPRADPACSGNLHHGIFSAAARTRVTKCFVGLAPNGVLALGNGGNGIVLKEKAVDSVIGNEGSGVAVPGPTYIRYVRRHTPDGAIGAVACARQRPAVSSRAGFVLPAAARRTSGNGLAGIECHASRVVISNVRIGLARNGRRPPNFVQRQACSMSEGCASRAPSERPPQCCQPGIYLGSDVANATIGSLRSDNISVNVVGASAGHGIEINALKTVVTNTYVGLGAGSGVALRNGGSGIRIRGRGHGTVIGGQFVHSSADSPRKPVPGSVPLTVFIGNNGEHGVHSSVNDVTVAGAWIGVIGRRGRLRAPNNGNGVYADARAVRLQVGTFEDNVIGLRTTVISANRLSGVNSSASYTSIQTANIGTDATGTIAVGNSIDGVFLSSAAAQSEVGMRRSIVRLLSGSSDAPRPPPLLIGGNTRHGILSNGPGTKVSNVLVGVTSARFVVSNGGDGIYFGVKAVGSTVGTADGFPSFVAGNGGNGITTAAPQSTVNNVITVAQARILPGACPAARRLGGGKCDCTPSAADAAGVVPLCDFGLQPPPNVTVRFAMAAGNGGHGIELLPAAQDSTVGGLQPHSTTVLSANRGDGIYCRAPRATIKQCFAGVDPSGRSRAGNGGSGLRLARTAVQSDVGSQTGIGGLNTVFSGNAEYGVRSDALKTRIWGCNVGVDARVAFALPIPNSKGGLWFEDNAEESTVGRNAAGATRGRVTVSGNGGDGIYSSAPSLIVGNAFIGVSPEGRFPRPNSGSGVLLDSGAESAYIGALNTIIAANALHGVYANAPAVTVAQLTIGLTADKKRAGNGGDGVRFALPASHSSVGDASAGTTATVICNNVGHGVYSEAPSTKVLQASIGVTFDMAPQSVPGPNGGDGVHLTSTAALSSVGGGANANASTVIGRNRGSGIYSAAPRSQVLHCHVGLLRSGEPAGNSAHGIILADSAVRSSVSSAEGAHLMAVANNLGDGLRISAPQCTVFNCLVGVNHLMQPAGNRGHGVLLSSTGVATIIGSDTQRYSTVIAGNWGAGIHSEARVLIRGCAVGFGSTGLSGALALPQGNLGAGIELVGPRATRSVVRQNRVGANQGDGILLRDGANNITVAANQVGLTKARATEGSLGNLGCGIRLRESSHALVGDFGQGGQDANWIGNNRLQGLRFDAVPIGDGQNFVLESNAYGFKACELCSCKIEGGTGALLVDCTLSGTASPPIPRDFGDGFPTSIPQSAVTLKLSNVGLRTTDWTALEVPPTLRRLDLSENPALDAAGLVGKLGSLEALDLRGTDLRELSTDKLLGLSQTLQAVDLSEPAQYPLVPVRFDGFARLASIVWHSGACPAGFSASPLWSERAGVALCLRIGCAGDDEYFGPGNGTRRSGQAETGLGGDDNDDGTVLAVAIALGVVVVLFSVAICWVVVRQRSRQAGYDPSPAGSGGGGAADRRPPKAKVNALQPRGGAFSFHNNKRDSGTEGIDVNRLAPTYAAPNPTFDKSSSSLALSEGSVMMSSNSPSEADEEGGGYLQITPDDDNDDDGAAPQAARAAYDMDGMTEI